MDMDALKERVFNERIRILQAKLEKAIEQRDRFARNYHRVARIPHQECRENLRDCDHEIESAGEPKFAGHSD